MTKIEDAVEDTKEYKFNNRKVKHRFGIYNFGKYSKKDNLVEYQKWECMLSRVFSKATHEAQPTYTDATVSENFKDFQYFAEWCNNQIGFCSKWHLDKDLLNKGNKHYSENNCVFLPYEINAVLNKRKKKRGDCPIGVCFRKDNQKFSASSRKDGVNNGLGCFDTPEEAFQAYKVAKESYLKDLANKWREQIDPRAYNALLAYEVHIDD